ncbi:GDP-mannose 6-dehydrogenase [Rhizomicrobium palustre]|uniref:UDP-glucose 6-dehydrogenase n=1 Tax=Rhizomicrobium palustre TaxID=189966 RepID=A0A846MTN5_9PROT|nr:nucleotide sugar dehydrogenase [Rhizomicrobium palustre]NIK86713.1 GDP-mannose 6-dehydrogenase [Rhizomicrobium palustre]
MKLSIFGMGYVGVVSGVCLARLGHQVIGVDVNADKVGMINRGQSPIVEPGVAQAMAELVAAGRLSATTDVEKAIGESDVSFISVGTPSSRSGAASLESIDHVTVEIGAAISAKTTPHTVVVRSTVPPGTVRDRIAPALARTSGRKLGEGLHIADNPEFLREGRAIKDFANPPFTLIGASDPAAIETLKALYKDIDAPFIETDEYTAESIKYLCNIFHAVKIGFANEAGAVLKELGVDAREALRVFCEDRVLNISPAYLKPGFAFGGSCLPKDLRGFLSLADARGVETPFLSSLMSSNERHITRAFEMITSGGRQKIAFFGLSFKPGTDDMRESPLVALAEKLIGKGYGLSIYDKDVELARLTGANKSFIEQEIPHLGALLKDSVEETLEGAGVIVIGHLGAAEAETVARLQKGRRIVDLQGVARLERLESYQGICW